MTGDAQAATVPPDLDGLLALALSRPHQALATARSLLADGAGPGVAAVAHQAAGIVLRDFGDSDEALVEFRAAIRCALRAGDMERAADVRAAYGVALVMAGRPRGLAEIDRAAAVATGTAAGRIEIRRSYALWLLGRYADMLRAAQRAVDLFAGSGEPVWEARALGHRATANLALGSVARADEDYARSEELFARTGQRLEYASALHDRATAAFARGDLPAALDSPGRRAAGGRRARRLRARPGRDPGAGAARRGTAPRGPPGRRRGSRPQHPAARVGGPACRAAVHRCAGGVRLG